MNTTCKLLLLWAFLGITCLGCTPKAEPEPKIDYQQLMTQIMKDLSPQLIGTWNLREVRVKLRSPGYGNPLNLTKDSIFRNLATMTIVPATKPRTLPIDPRRGEYEGTIRYRNKTYPIRLNMWPSTWVYERKGPQAFLLLDYNFPEGIRTTESEEQFLVDLGLVYDTFSLETTIGQPTMKWVGLNRGIDRIEFVKQ